MSARVRCEVCDVNVAYKGLRAHEQTTGHQEAAPLFLASRAAEAQAHNDGLDRLIDFDFAPYDQDALSTASAGHDRLTPVFDALGIPVLALPTGFHRGTRYSHRYDELWTVWWAANVANWKEVEFKTRVRALERLAAEPNLREYVRDWPPVIGMSVRLVGLEFSSGHAIAGTARRAGMQVWVSQPGSAHLMILLDPSDKWTSVESWDLTFSPHGEILEFRSSHWPQHEEMPMPPLNVMIETQGAIEKFARCSATIRWLAGGT